MGGNVTPFLASSCSCRCSCIAVVVAVAFAVTVAFAVSIAFAILPSPKRICFCRCLFVVAVILAAAVVLAVASEVERGFSPASKRPPQSGHRSAEGRSEGEAATTDLLPLPLLLQLFVAIASRASTWTGPSQAPAKPTTYPHHPQNPQQNSMSSPQTTQTKQNKPHPHCKRV